MRALAVPGRPRWRRFRSEWTSLLLSHSSTDFRSMRYWQSPFRIPHSKRRQSLSPNVALTFLPVPVPSFTKKHMNTPEPSSSPCPDQPDSTVQPSNDSTSAPPLINSQTPKLSAFTAPMTLKEIGYDRVFRFFRPFALDLQSAGISWPEFHPGNDDFYVNLAQL